MVTYGAGVKGLFDDVETGTVETFSPPCSASTSATKSHGAPRKLRRRVCMGLLIIIISLISISVAGLCAVRDVLLELEEFGISPASRDSSAINISFSVKVSKVPWAHAAVIEGARCVLSHGALSSDVLAAELAMGMEVAHDGNVHGRIVLGIEQTGGLREALSDFASLRPEAEAQVCHCTSLNDARPHLQSPRPHSPRSFPITHSRAQLHCLVRGAVRSGVFRGPFVANLTFGATMQGESEALTWRLSLDSGGLGMTVHASRPLEGLITSLYDSLPPVPPIHLNTTGWDGQFTQQLGEPAGTQIAPIIHPSPLSSLLLPRLRLHRG